VHTEFSQAMPKLSGSFRMSKKTRDADAADAAFTAAANLVHPWAKQ
jgi:hypothetical protein